MKWQCCTRRPRSGLPCSTVPLVDVRVTLLSAVRRGIVAAGPARAMRNAAAACFWRDRDWPTLLEAWRPLAEAETLAQIAAHTWSIKASDAAACVFAALAPDPPTPRVAAPPRTRFCAILRRACRGAARSAIGAVSLEQLVDTRDDARAVLGQAKRLVREQPVARRGSAGGLPPGQIAARPARAAARAGANARPAASCASAIINRSITSGSAIIAKYSTASGASPRNSASRPRSA